MKNDVASRHRRLDRPRVEDRALRDPYVAPALRRAQIGAPAGREVVENGDRPAFGPGTGVVPCAVRARPRICAGSRWALLPVEKSSRTVTAQFSATRWSTRWLPI